MLRTPIEVGLGSYPAVGTEAVGRDLQGDLELGLLAHLLRQVVGLPDQGFGLQNLLPQHL